MKRIRPKRLFGVAFLLLAIWVAADLFIPKHADLRQFDPIFVGKMDSDMWRAYYEKKPAKLFFQLARLMRKQYHAPYWRSFFIAYRAAKAAFVFKEGRNRADYAKALPPLEKFYNEINRLSNRPFDVKRVAQLELEWWIIRREPDQFSPADWERILAEEAGVMYHEPAEKMVDYARLRTEAMVFRDEKRDNIQAADWEIIERLLVDCWQALNIGLRNQGVEELRN